jgi:predicted phosphoribosyltransferase
MGVLFERAELHGAIDVFRDRAHAGELLTDLLREAGPSITRVLAVPAGGVPVAIPVARGLGLPLDLAVVSKITLPWNTESGYGAVAFDGSILLNHELLRSLPLTQDEIDEGIARTQRKVARRARRLRKTEALPDLAGERVALVDDGLASGFTMRAAVAACGRRGAASVGVAVPTAHERALQRLEHEADWIACLNVRAGASFAVADAYLRWYDVPELEVERLLEERPGTASERSR